MQAMKGKMNQVASLPHPNAGQSLVLDGVDWRMYSSLLRALAERPNLRLTYCQGRLEIMSPLLEHEDDAWFLGLLVAAMADELDLPLRGSGSTTLRRQLSQCGIEADQSFWIANASRMARKRRLDLRTDPPPDLAIEIEVTRSAFNRLGIYAALGVPEIWRLRRNVLTFHVLGAAGSYASAAHSKSFPVVTPADLLRCLRQVRHSGNEIPVVREFRKWIRTKI